MRRAYNKVEWLAGLAPMTIPSPKCLLGKGPPSRDCDLMGLARPGGQWPDGKRPPVRVLIFFRAATADTKRSIFDFPTADDRAPVLDVDASVGRVAGMILGREDGASALMGSQQPGRLQTPEHAPARFVMGQRLFIRACGVILFATLSLDQLGHRPRGVRHMRGEAPLVVIPSDHANHPTRSANPNRHARRKIYAPRIDQALELPIVKCRRQ